jgi:hypothetical protein
MGILRNRKRPTGSVIRPEDIEARRQKLFEEMRVRTHALCALELTDVTPFIDELVDQIRENFVDKGEVWAVQRWLPDKLQPVALSPSFNRSLCDMIRRAVPEKHSFHTVWHEDVGHGIRLEFPSPIHYQPA